MLEAGSRRRERTGCWEAEIKIGRNGKPEIGGRGRETEKELTEKEVRKVEMQDWPAKVEGWKPDAEKHCGSAQP